MSDAATQTTSTPVNAKRAVKALGPSRTKLMRVFSRRVDSRHASRHKSLQLIAGAAALSSTTMDRISARVNMLERARMNGRLPALVHHNSTRIMARVANSMRDIVASLGLADRMLASTDNQFAGLACPRESGARLSAVSLDDASGTDLSDLTDESDIDVDVESSDEYSDNDGVNNEGVSAPAVTPATPVKEPAHDGSDDDGSAIPPPPGYQGAEPHTDTGAQAVPVVHTDVE